jgi:hypothetical protein
MIIDYNDPNFEKLGLQSIESRDEFLVKVKGWKAKSIAIGLKHYRFSIVGARVNSLRLIPYGLIAPTFWTICVRAGFESLWPDWRFENNELMVRFAKRN